MLTKVCIIKSIIFPVVMHRCKGWAIKKVDHQRIDFVLWYWRRFLRAPWTARRSNQPILKGINPEYSLEELMLKPSLLAQSSKEHACQCSRHKRCGFDPWARKIFQRRKWQSTPVFLLGKSHGQRSLMSYSPWGRKELDTTEQLNHHHWCWSWSSNTLATWCKELIHWKRPTAGKDWGQQEKGATEDR